MYDSTNIFARIIQKQIPCQLVCETDHSLAFHDIEPQAKCHVLLVPKGPYVTIGHFLGKASTQEKEDFFSVMHRLPHDLAIQDDGYRWITNAGRFGRQEVPHFHMHLLGGEPLPLFKNGQVIVAHDDVCSA